jgi:putative hydrolase of the HAD superfamily
MKHATLIFDGDDTLWETHFLYEKAKTEAASLLIDIGIEVDRDNFAHIVNQFSVDFGKKYGFISSRFPTALSEAYKVLCERRRVEPNEMVLEDLWKIGMSVATQLPKQIPQAREVLEILSRKYTCILYTLGDEEQQLFRLNTVSLAQYFKHVFVVLHKNEDALRNILFKLNLNPVSTWMIGNSASSDIGPALRAGLQCIWLRSEHWLFDEAHLDTSRVYQIVSIDEIVPIVEEWERKNQ